jgi:L-fuconolactonase
MRLDAHQHFWKYDSVQYDWIKPDWPIRRDFLPSDLQPLLQQHGFDGTIAVQARQSLEESRWLLALADDFPFIKGVVGWVDLQSEKVNEQLAELAVHSRFVGVRHVLQDEPDEFMLKPEFLRGIGALKQFGLTYDILIFPRQLPTAIELARKFPEQKFVLDHLAKPLVRHGTLSPWREQMCELAQSPNVFCKVSGLITEADWANWKSSELKPYFEIALELFGESRLMYGSDWPVCLLAGNYERVFRLQDDFAQQLGSAGCAKFFGGNAAEFYRIDK